MVCKNFSGWWKLRSALSFGKIITISQITASQENSCWRRPEEVIHFEAGSTMRLDWVTQAFLQLGLQNIQDGEHTASLDNLFCLTVFMVEKLLLYPVWTCMVLFCVCCLSSHYHEPHGRAWLRLSWIIITWQATVRSPWSLRFYRLNEPGFFNVSSQSKCSSPVTSLVASTELLTLDEHLSHTESPRLDTVI